MTHDDSADMTFGQRLRTARKNGGLTQEQLAERLLVTRQAIVKWESDKGLPDIENLKNLSRRLNVSIDYLLDNGEKIDFTVVREPIDLEPYQGKQKIGKRWRRKKSIAKDYIVMEKYPDAEIHYLMGEQILTKEEKVVDNLLGFLTDASFGIPDIINGLKNIDKEFYLVIDGEKQFLITVTDEFMEIRQLSHNISEKKFVIGEFKFVDCGVMNIACRAR